MPVHRSQSQMTTNAPTSSPFKRPVGRPPSHPHHRTHKTRRYERTRAYRHNLKLLKPQQTRFDHTSMPYDQFLSHLLDKLDALTTTTSPFDDNTLRKAKRHVEKLREPYTRAGASPSWTVWVGPELQERFLEAKEVWCGGVNGGRVGHGEFVECLLNLVGGRVEWVGATEVVRGVRGEGVRTRRRGRPRKEEEEEEEVEEYSEAEESDDEQDGGGDVKTETDGGGYTRSYTTSRTPPTRFKPTFIPAIPLDTDIDTLSDNLIDLTASIDDGDTSTTPLPSHTTDPTTSSAPNPLKRRPPDDDLSYGSSPPRPPSKRRSPAPSPEPTLTTTLTSPTDTWTLNWYPESGGLFTHFTSTEDGIIRGEGEKVLKLAGLGKGVRVLLNGREVACGDGEGAKGGEVEVRVGGVWRKGVNEVGVFWDEEVLMKDDEEVEGEDVQSGHGEGEDVAAVGNGLGEFFRSVVVNDADGGTISLDKENTIPALAPAEGPHGSVECPALLGDDDGCVAKGVQGDTVEGLKGKIAMRKEEKEKDRKKDDGRMGLAGRDVVCW
ncbi:hypothetical protein HDV00_007345 [Rhizophlyctis rosea]|nr:hypothetical protein HDV00_007345 [Rhizophlyctis rosea]